MEDNGLRKVLLAIGGMLILFVISVVTWFSVRDRFECARYNELMTEVANFETRHFATDPRLSSAFVSKRIKNQKPWQEQGIAFREFRKKNFTLQCENSEMSPAWQQRWAKLFTSTAREQQLLKQEFERFSTDVAQALNREFQVAQEFESMAKADIHKFCHFLKQELRMKQSLARLNFKCEKTTAKRMIASCEKSIVKLSRESKMDEENILRNRAILMSKWSEHKDWIEGQVQNCETEI